MAEVLAILFLSAVQRDWLYVQIMACVSGCWLHSKRVTAANTAAFSSSKEAVIVLLLLLSFVITSGMLWLPLVTTTAYSPFVLPFDAEPTLYN